MDKLKTLRELTGISVMECKKALDEAGGDLEKAKIILSKRGVEIAAKKADRATGSGRIFAYVHHNGKVASLVELLCETDFVAMNDSFKSLGADLAMQAASLGLSEKEALMESEFIKDPSKTVAVLLKESIFALGENLQLGEVVVVRL